MSEETDEEHAAHEAELKRWLSGEEEAGPPQCKRMRKRRRYYRPLTPPSPPPPAPPPPAPLAPVDTLEPPALRDFVSRALAEGRATVKVLVEEEELEEDDGIPTFVIPENDFNAVCVLLRAAFVVQIDADDKTVHVALNGVPRLFGPRKLLPVKKR